MITPTCDKPNWKDAQELKNAVREWCDRIQVTVKQVQLRPMKRKWASISHTGRLTLNTGLLNLPTELGEFVIVHELVHLSVPNHGKLFKCLMSAYLPDWQEKEQKLQIYQNM
ncbi:metal-dependent hydrolase-like protein [Trichormus variabilis ATCC 29413]|uniref:Metal-dependent hydrolase-like protein n=2 Tax=Anabaena variabilis TaxID=264691 RepID=Q3ME07_TRIV2|nr:MULTISPECIES: M48 family metallopeptidase [Nostocaceae]ABA20779.1 metal-dependent hydrolase-like protein [Trichormus variabilis ATCC 29413]MBC1213972.1 M48 family metallopeptidase [Trichormus variabilis ARAD]MBC1255675.1 M48 family metallopeptidase [Trichormus variabilis V5]MBC1266816.1 M48 family metallopeptidase [Trichormus variabilis FSR]MBC1302301.1 M48 family metallopeptidase [Trichormus variabilis N2B]